MTAADCVGSCPVPGTGAARVDSAEEFGELSVVVHETRGVEETVEAVAEFAVKAVGCTAAAIALWTRRSGLRAVAATMAGMDLLLGADLPTTEGPVADVLDEVEALSIGEVDVETRWPAWCARASALGLHSLLLLRLSVGDRPAGVVLLGHTDPHAFDRDDLAIADIVARHASIAVATAQHEASLAQAVDARKLVGQAMGILMERFGIGADDAFAVLRRYSQVGNVKLRDVARHLIETRRLPPLPLPHSDQGGG